MAGPSLKNGLLTNIEISEFSLAEAQQAVDICDCSVTTFGSAARGSIVRTVNASQLRFNSKKYQLLIIVSTKYRGGRMNVYYNMGSSTRKKSENCDVFAKTSLKCWKTNTFMKSFVLALDKKRH